jgi:hypothetical protein
MSDKRRFYSQHIAASAALLLPFLAGCAAPPDWTKVDQQAFTIRAACERQHEGGTIATNLATEQCANDRILELYTEERYPRLDVLATYLQQREAIAAAVDRHAIPPADAHMKLAEAQTEQNAALRKQGVDPIVFDVAPMQVQDTCPRPSPIAPAARLCN